MIFKKIVVGGLTFLGWWG